jgi:DNA polymerase-3 subunit delta'
MDSGRGQAPGAGMSDDGPPKEEFESFGPRQPQTVLGLAAAEQAVLTAWTSGRMPHAWLIAGPKGIGKATFAFRVARFILSGERVPNPASLDIPDSDVTNRLVAGFSHPRLLTLERGWDEKNKRLRKEIAVEDVRRLTRFLAMRAEPGEWRVCVIDATDDLNRSSANAALKAIEEPPARCVFLLVCNSPGRVLPTIRSRCRRLNLRALPEADIAAILTTRRPDLDPGDAAVVARLAEGSPGRAIALADAGGAGLHRDLMAVLERLPRLDLSRLHSFAESLARPTAEPAYRAVCDLLRGWMARLAGATGIDGAVPLPAPEAALVERIRRDIPLEGRVALWDKVTALIDSADRANLDRKLVLMTAFHAIEAAAKA